MQLKQEANTEPRKRFHLLARLRKAVKHAEELERLCESNRVDAKTKLEAQVTATILNCFAAEAVKTNSHLLEVCLNSSCCRNVST